LSVRERTRVCPILLTLLNEGRIADWMVVPKAPWSAVASATAFSFEIEGGSLAAALHGASRIFIHSGEPKDHGIFA